MKDDDLPIGRKADVAFDSEAVRDGAVKGRHRVFPISHCSCRDGRDGRLVELSASHGAASVDLHDRIDLDGGIQRQGGHANSGAGMLAGFAEDLGDQV